MSTNEGEVQTMTPDEEVETCANGNQEESKSTGGQNSVWPEIRKALETKRYELCLVGPEISKRIEDNKGYLDSNLYKLTHLNFLEVAKTKLSIMPRQIGQIENLQSLVFHTNELTSIPVEIGKLIHLKNLDFSNNKLAHLPDEINNLKELFTVNLNGNQLTNLFSLKDLTKLAVLDIGRNKFKNLPEGMGSANLENLSQINASFNELTELPDDLYELPSLKVLNVENNSLTHVPANLSQSNKLKDLLVKENKLKDNRLKKMVEQDKLKAILDYLKKVYEEESKNKPKSKSSAGASNSTSKSKSKNTNASFVVEYDLIKVLHFNDATFSSKIVTIMDSVNDVRPFILCAILRDIDLEFPGNLKKFLAIQTKIQDEKCDRRNLATIATHDLANVPSNNLVYEAEDPNKIELVPLGRKNPISALEFYEKLNDEAEAERKAKKRNQLSGIYKYLSLLEDKKIFSYLRDENKNVLSLPPLTNSEKTRMSTSTKDILIEITSGESIDICKTVMEDLLFEMINANLTSKQTDLNEKLEKLSINSEASKEESSAPASTDDSNSKIKSTIIMQQVKTVDSKGQLKTVYPSRVDLGFSGLSKIKVIRLYDD